MSSKRGGGAQEILGGAILSATPLCGIVMASQETAAVTQPVEVASSVAVEPAAEASPSLAQESPVDDEEGSGVLATLQINYIEEISKEIQNKLQEWTPQLAWLSPQSKKLEQIDEGGDENPPSSIVTLDQRLAGLEDFCDHQGSSLTYATTTGDVRFLMTLFGSKLSPLHPFSTSSSLAANMTASSSDVNGWTPLHQAAASGDSQLIQVLQWRGDDIDARAFDGSTPLCIACEKVL
jgi:hypothetical protein